VRIDDHEFPAGLWYHPQEHLWISVDDADASGAPIVTVGVDAIGVHALGEVVYLQLLEPGQEVERGQAIGSLEAEKMVRPVLAPVSGTLVESNHDVLSRPGLLSSDGYGRGWLVRIQARDWVREAGDLLHAPEAVEAWARAESKTIGDAG
jgi:glycine cleavage system H protein